MFFFKVDDDQMTNRLKRNEHSRDGIHLICEEPLNWKNEPEQRNTDLEEKLADDHELGVTGIINLSSMNLTDHDVPMVIQRAFGVGSKKCVGLLLRDNDLSSNGVKMIADALLATRSKLKYLSFSNNSSIGDAGVEHLVRLLQTNRSITFLALPHTGMTDHGVRLLADVLCAVDDDSTCPSLEKLYISFNKLITDESLEVFLQILEQNQTLKVLSLENCSLSDKAQRRLKQVVTKTKKKKFSLSG